MKNSVHKTRVLLSIIALSCFNHAIGQDKLKSMPGYEHYKEIAPQIRSSIQSGSLSVEWNESGESFTYSKDGNKWQYDIKKGKPKKIGEAESSGNYHWNWDGPQRGRQYASAISPNEKLKAFTRNRNLWLSDADGQNEIAITTDGNEENQRKYGIATWVYGEELGQTTAMWWSPDSKKIAFYQFDEKEAKKYYVLYNQTLIQDSIEIEAYPKVGARNLPVEILIYDLETEETITLDVRDGRPFDDDHVGTYLYGIQWSPDGKELLFHRTNRKQDVMEWAAANPVTGKTRTIVHEEWRDSFTENTPEMYLLEDGKRFIWCSERTGFKNYYLYDFSGRLIHAITQHDFEVSSIVDVDEDASILYYMVRSGNNHMKFQLHKVNFDGSGNQRLTNPVFNHRVTLSPDRKYFIDVAQTHDIPPFTNLMSSNGKFVDNLAESDMSKFEEVGLKKVEVFTFTAADGKTELHGVLHFPSNFDPHKKYPVLLANYGGPATNEFWENFTYPSSLTELGFLLVKIDGRNVGGRGKHLLDQLYGNLGIVEIDDFTEGIKSLYDRPYFDRERVGVFGTSYGGTVAATCILRYPEVFRAACANSAVTDWRNYDNIYTERYMNLLENNHHGYEASSIMKYAPQLEGALMIYFGTSDNNVHPANSLQLIEALQKAGKSIEVQIGPDQGHTALDRSRMMEFFIQHLVLDRSKR